MEEPQKLKDKLAALPDAPGCYLMRDKRGKIVYVGKAASLRKRVQSYFRKATLKSADPKLRGLIKSIADLDIVVLRNEAEALLTEGRLIKEYRPRYNVRFKDDKRFLLLTINIKSKYPRFELCRIQRDDGRSYFGPYASAAAARAALRFVERRFGLRSCRPADPGSSDYEHCIDDIVRYCAAPCVAKITKQDYRKNAEEACAFLRGERPQYLGEVRSEMEAASAKHDYEKAAALRDAMFRLSDVTRTKAKVLSTPEMRADDGKKGVHDIKAILGLSKLPRLIEAYDISNISGTYSVASMVCAVDGMPRKQRYRRFRIKTIEGADDPASMAEVVTRSYRRRIKEKKPLPDLVLVDGGITQVRAARNALRELGLGILPVAGLAKKYEELYWDESGAPIRLRPRSLALQIFQRLRDEAHRFALDYHRSLRRRRIKESVLDDIPGIGTRRKQELLVHFGSIRRLMRASEDDISAVSGFGRQTAKAIHIALHSSDQ